MSSAALDAIATSGFLLALPSTLISKPAMPGSAAAMRPSASTAVRQVAIGVAVGRDAHGIDPRQELAAQKAQAQRDAIRRSHQASPMTKLGGGVWNFGSRGGSGSGRAIGRFAGIAYSNFKCDGVDGGPGVDCPPVAAGRASIAVEFYSGEIRQVLRNPTQMKGGALRSRWGLV